MNARNLVDPCAVPDVNRKRRIQREDLVETRPRLPEAPTDVGYKPANRCDSTGGCRRDLPYLKPPIRRARDRAHREGIARAVPALQRGLAWRWRPPAGNGGRQLHEEGNSAKSFTVIRGTRLA